MDLTVCVCTHNRPGYLRDCLAGLRRQTAGQNRFTVLIVDSGSSSAARAELRELAEGHAGARLIRVDAPGVSAARNAGAAASTTGYIAYTDDDAVPAEDWVASILAVLAVPGGHSGHDAHAGLLPGAPRSTGQLPIGLPPAGCPAVLGGRVLPRWEAPLPAWWPPSLRGVLSIIEHEGQGEFRTAALPKGLEPYACNMIVHVPALLAAGGFGTGIGRVGTALLSDEEVQLAWRLQDAGMSARYDSRIVVFHQIQARRLNPGWLLSRLYWQGASTVLTRRLLRAPASVWRELPRRLVITVLFAPFALWPRSSPRCLAPRWRWAYAAGFVRAALGWRATEAARQIGTAAPASASLDSARSAP